MKEKKKNLFQITEAAHACGVSRSTLMRMEAKGLLKPAFISPESGRRYYDNFNVAHVLQVQKFQRTGLTNEEIISYYESGGQISGLLEALEAKLGELQRSVEELRLRSKETSGASVQIITLPETTCRMRQFTGSTTKEKYDAMFALYGDCIKDGYVLADEPMFTILERDDFLKGYISNDPYVIHVCVPVKDINAKEVVKLPAVQAISVLFYGEYDAVDEGWLMLGKELKKRGLTPTGFPRVLGLVAPYTGKEIQTKRYCSRLVLPVK